MLVRRKRTVTMVNINEDTLLTTDDAAAFLRKLGLHISATYLASLRGAHRSGKGPNYVKWGGKVVYRQNADLLPWVHSRLHAVA
jgi:hypothetical protein